VARVGACLVPLLRASLALGMQFKGVWFPRGCLGPGPGRAVRGPEPGSLKTNLPFIFA
jgi:hypothetical protein